MIDPALSSMPKPRFLLDVDGVLADFVTSALPLIEEVTGTRYEKHDFTTWDFFDVVPKTHKAAVYASFTRPGFCAGIPVFEGSREGVRRLRKLADVRIVTTPIWGPHWYGERAAWLDKHIGIHESHIVFRSEKEFEHGDFLLDDRPSHVELWAARHPQGVGLLWSQPCNAQHVLSAHLPNVHRVSTWDEVVGRVEAMLCARERR